MLYSVPVKNYYGEEQRMDESREIEYLMHFGLSRQEALIYRKLLEGGKRPGMRLREIPGFPGRMPMLRLRQWWKKVLHIW